MKEYTVPLGKKRWRVSWSGEGKKKAKMVTGTLSDARKAIDELPLKEYRERLKEYELNRKSEK